MAARCSVVELLCAGDSIKPHQIQEVGVRVFIVVSALVVGLVGTRFLRVGVVPTNPKRSLCRAKRRPASGDRCKQLELVVTGIA